MNAITRTLLGTPRGLLHAWVCALIVLTAVGTASAQMKVNDNLTITGFIDMSALLEDDGDETSVNGGVDQMEISFLLEFDEVSAHIDINSLPTGVVMEEANVTYTPESTSDIGFSLTVGRFLSALGWECAEPICLFQHSVSQGIPYPGYQNGVAVRFAPTDKVSFYAAALASAWDVNDTDWETAAFEGQVSLKPIEEITAKIGFATEDMGEYFKTELNAWASFTSGALTLAGEVDILDNWDADGEAGIHFLGMANYALSDRIAVTGRFSGIDLDSSGTKTEVTVSPSYKVTDNWSVLAEVRRNIDAETTQIAVEQIFTF